MIKNVLEAIWYLITAPFYFLIILFDMIIGTGLSDWAAGKLGLHGPDPEIRKSDGLIGAVAEVLQDFNYSATNQISTGMIRVQGEIWSAQSSTATPLTRGSSVRIFRQDGLSLFVEPL